MQNAPQNGNGRWQFCRRCKKKLCKRLPNGVFVFEFGKKRGDANSEPRVQMQINGDFKIKCTNKDCRMENTFNKFPVHPKQTSLQPKINP